MKNETPTAAELRTWLDDNSIHQTAAAGMVRVNPRTFRRYVNLRNPTRIPYAVWFTLLTKHQLAKIKEARD
jgi:hypothetical protein